MFWSMKETPRLRVIRRIVAYLSVIVGTILAVEQIGAIGLGIFSQPKPHFLLIGVLLVVSGIAQFFVQRRTDT